jgi:hypothetical protein
VSNFRNFRTSLSAGRQDQSFDWILRTGVAVGSVIAVLTFSCCARSPNPNSRDAKAETTTSGLPPFPTKEPERYRALRVTTFSESTANAPQPVNETRSSNVLIARDGENRRAEFDLKGGGRLVFIESPAARFVLLTASRIYAAIDIASESNLAAGSDEFSGVSPDLLVNEAPAVATYQKLGSESLEGRTTTKYRVTRGTRNGDNSATDETLIWIDEALGMPVRSEAVHNDSVRSTRSTMELKDIQLDVDPVLFALPQDYKKVETAVIFELARKAAANPGSN